MAFRRTPYGARFMRTLRDFCDQSHLTGRTLAKLLDIPKTTVGRWLRGASSPSIPTLKRVCAKLGWGHDQFFLPANLFDEIYADKFLSLAAVGHRYLAMQSTKPFDSMPLVSLSASLLALELARRDIPTNQMISANFEVNLSFPDLPELGVSILGDAQAGIVFQLLTITEGVALFRTERRVVSSLSGDEIARAVAECKRAH